MADDLVQQLCALVEEYKLSYEAADASLDVLTAELEKVASEKQELEALVQYSDVYVAEMEDSLQTLDRELARAQGQSARKDVEARNLCSLLRDYEKQEKRRSEAIEVSEMTFLRDERRRLLEETAQQERELDDFEALVGKQQASILDLSLQVKRLESEAANYRKILRAGSPRGSRSQRHKRPSDQLPLPQQQYQQEEEEGIDMDNVSLVLELPQEEKATRSSTPKGKKEPAASPQKWSDGKKHRGLFREISLQPEPGGTPLDSDDSYDASQRQRWTAVSADGTVLGVPPLPLPPPPPPKSDDKVVAALLGRGLGTQGGGSGSGKEGEPASLSSKASGVGERSQSLARSIYRRAKEALMARRQEFEGARRERKEEGGGDDDWEAASVLSVSSHHSQSQSCGDSQGDFFSKRRPQPSSRRSSGRSVVPIDC